LRRAGRIVIAILVFLLVGELVVRFDQATWFFREYRMMELQNEAHATPLYRAVGDGTFAPADDQWRVMVVGDSYLHGNHVLDDRRFAVRLEAALQAARPRRRVVVLDATVPGANTCTNARTFDELRGGFRPHAVVWGYNADDVYGGCGEAGGAAAPAPPPRTLVSTVRWLQAAAYRLSALLGYVGPTVATELEIRGLVLPGTHTHHQFTRSHRDDFPAWQRSRADLQAVSDTCRVAGVDLLVLNCPDLAMLGHYGPLEDMDARIAAFFNGLGVGYLRGIDLFADGAADDWAVSRYDGHPNGAAHGVLAAGVADVLLRDQRP
jgi:hypothetical protein